MKEKENKTFYLAILHILLLFYSCGGIISKLASCESFLSLKFCLLYGGLIFVLGTYAIVWQQIIKRIPLTLAYANKAVTVIWGMLWGILFFRESISVTKLLGAIIVVIGVVFYSIEDNKKGDKNK